MSKTFGSVFYPPLIEWMFGKHYRSSEKSFTDITNVIFKPEKLSNQMMPPLVNIVMFMLYEKKMPFPYAEIYNCVLFAQKISQLDGSSIMFHMEPRQLKKGIFTKKRSKKTSSLNIKKIDPSKILTVACPPAMNKYFTEEHFSKAPVMPWKDFVAIPIVNNYFNHIIKIISIATHKKNTNELAKILGLSLSTQ